MLRDFMSSISKSLIPNICILLKDKLHKPIQFSVEFVFLFSLCVESTFSEAAFDKRAEKKKSCRRGAYIGAGRR